MCFALLAKTNFFGYYNGYYGITGVIPCLGSQRQKELLDLRESDSESGSEDEEDNSSEEESDSLSLLRRDLYLGLLCLFILIVLLAHWAFSTFLRR